MLLLFIIEFVHDITSVQQIEVIFIYIKCDGAIVVIASVETNTYTNFVHANHVAEWGVIVWGPVWGVDVQGAIVPVSSASDDGAIVKTT